MKPHCFDDRHAPFPLYPEKLLRGKLGPTQERNATPRQSSDHRLAEVQRFGNLRSWRGCGKGPPTHCWWEGHKYTLKAPLGHWLRPGQIYPMGHDAQTRALMAAWFPKSGRLGFTHLPINRGLVKPSLRGCNGIPHSCQENEDDHRESTQNCKGEGVALGTRVGVGGALLLTVHTFFFNFTERV